MGKRKKRKGAASDSVHVSAISDLMAEEPSVSGVRNGTRRRKLPGTARSAPVAPNVAIPADAEQVCQVLARVLGTLLARQRLANMESNDEIERPHAA